MHAQEVGWICTRPPPSHCPPLHASCHLSGRTTARWQRQSMLGRGAMFFLQGPAPHQAGGRAFQHHRAHKQQHPRAKEQHGRGGAPHQCSRAQPAQRQAGKHHGAAAERESSPGKMTPRVVIGLCNLCTACAVLSSTLLISWAGHVARQAGASKERQPPHRSERRAEAAPTAAFTGTIARETAGRVKGHSTVLKAWQGQADGGSSWERMLGRLHRTAGRDELQSRRAIVQGKPAGPCGRQAWWFRWCKGCRERADAPGETSFSTP